MKHIIMSTSYNNAKDSMTIKNLPGNVYKFPITKVKNQVICDNGDKLLVIDTLLYSYPIRRLKLINLTTCTYTTLGQFKSIGGNSGSAVIWTTPPQIGNYIEYSIPADSIYTKPYDIKLDYAYKSTYVKVKIYIDGDSLQNLNDHSYRFDLGSTTNATPVGTLYRYFIASNYLIKKYRTHTIRFEVAGIKGNATEIMDVRKLTLGLKD